jgi:hypothetical protein
MMQQGTALGKTQLTVALKWALTWMGRGATFPIAVHPMHVPVWKEMEYVQYVTYASAQG